MSKYKKVNVPIIVQLEEQEGGAACLDMILAYYKKWIRLEQVREDCGVSRDGIQPELLVHAAEGYGLSCSLEAVSFDELKKQKTFPIISVLNNSQYVVLCGFGRKGVYLNHPSKGKIVISEEDFRNKYSGESFLLKPGPDFVCEGRRNGTVDYIMDFIRENRRIVVLLFITGVLATFGGIVSPIFHRIFTDEVLAGNRRSWYPDILFAFVAVLVFELVAGILNQILLIRSKGKVTAVKNASYMRHIFYLPMDFFMRRKTGDLSNRQEQNNTIVDTFISSFIPQIMNIILLLFYITVMLSYNVMLTVIGIVSTVANLLLMKRIGSMRKQINEVYFQCKANLDATTVSGIDMIDTIKATGAENAFYERWSGYQASMINAQVVTLKKTSVLANVPAFITSLSENIIMFMGFVLIIHGAFTAGMILTFFQLMKAMTKPVDQLVDAGENLDAMSAAIDRVNDVMNYPEEAQTDIDDSSVDYEKVKKLGGSIELKDISFGYSRGAEPLIEDFNLTLTPGKRVAIVGESGSGKSTIAKMIAGLNKPWGGEILYDGKRIEEIPRVLFKASVALVDQEVALFNDTIANNIKMWDNSIEDYEMIISARDAGIHDQIRRRSGGYNMIVEPRGANLSGGEKQRIEIARVLSNEPSILVMDEATSALDARTEYEISEYIHDRGITCIIVAHRLSTIRDCDEIIVMDHGKVVQRGTHEELMKIEGHYRKLVMSA